MCSVLTSGEAVHSGINTIIFEFDEAIHMNNVYIYGYPSTPSQRILFPLLFHLDCVYIPYSRVVDHSPLTETHDPNVAFDYSNDYFYFESRQRGYLTFDNAFFE